eukprot:jgi/Mesvir1/25473/Mv01737-RA.1
MATSRARLSSMEKKGSVDACGGAVLVAAAASCISAQLAKPLVLIWKERSSAPRITLRSFFRSGGMPSSHAASVTSLATAVGLERGFDDALFAACFVYACVVIYDAQGVRRQAGYHADVLNAAAAQGWLGPQASTQRATLNSRAGEAAIANLRDGPTYLSTAGVANGEQHGAHGSVTGSSSLQGNGVVGNGAAGHSQAMPLESRDNSRDGSGPLQGSMHGQEMRDGPALDILECLPRATDTQPSASIALPGWPLGPGAYTGAGNDAGSPQSAQAGPPWPHGNVSLPTGLPAFPLKTSIGHTKAEVVAGSILGVLVALLVHSMY